MIEAIDLVESGLNLDAVIPFHAVDCPREVRLWRKGRGIWRRRKIDSKLRVDQINIGLAQIRIDLGREEIVDIGARPLTGCVFGSSPLMMS